MVDLATEFLIVAAIVILGFIGEQVFGRTGVPNFIWLIAIGILLGPIFNVFPRTTLISSLGIFAELTLLIVLFYGGMDTTFSALMAGGGRAFIQALFYVIPSIVGVAALTTFLFHWSPIQSLIFGSIIGGETTAAVMIPLSRSLKLNDQLITFISLESAMNSIFSIILFSVFVGSFETLTSSVTAAVASIAATFSVGIVAGAILSLGWVFLLSRWRTQRYTYVFTIGLILLTFSLATIAGGSGQLAVLVFGVVLGNYQLVAKLFKGLPNMDVLQSQLRTFYGEISFLLRTLFFVSLGLAFVILPGSILGSLAVGIILVAVLLVIRRSAVALSTAGSTLVSDSNLITMMCAMGLTPATLAIISVNMGLVHSDTYLNLVTYVILFTNAITAYASIRRMRRNRYPMAEFTKALEGYL